MSKWFCVLFFILAGCRQIPYKEGEVSSFVEHVVEDNKTKAGMKVCFKF